MTIPNGAQEIIAVRKKGMKPAELIIVSLIGKLDELNHTIYANPGANYDWRWSVGLKIVLFTKPGVDCKPILKAIARSKPEWLAIYDVDQFKGAEVSLWPLVDDIDKPASLWRYKLHFFPWNKFENERFSWS